MEHRWIVGPIVVAMREHGSGRRSPTARGTGEEMLAQLIREFVGVDLPVGRRCPNCGAADHGRPTVQGNVLTLSVSYGSGAVAVAAAPSAAIAALGVDIEEGAADVEAIPGITLRDWARVEAAMKADGRAALLDPSAALLHPDGVRFPGARAWVSTVLDAPAGFQLALAHRAL
ncbi:hypothetical protein [Microbacterium gorillae]|uniref:hypothetical protein n=1 Tax=Microbacterium gorillae TaxID=1231063 RepID=UPI003D9926C7